MIYNHCALSLLEFHCCHSLLDQRGRPLNLWILLCLQKFFFLATIFGKLGIPLSDLMWYRPLYHAMRHCALILLEFHCCHSLLDQRGRFKVFSLATIYGMLGIRLSYLMWYRPLYHAISLLNRTDSTFSFGWFFLCYQLHIDFCITAAIAPPIVFRAKSLTGILATIDTFSDHATYSLWSGIPFTSYLLGRLAFCA